MDNRDLGMLLGAAAIRLFGIGLAVYVAVTVATYVVHVFTAVNNGLSVLG